MLRTKLLTALLAACTLAAQSNPATGSIAGQVVNALSRAPIRKAGVSLTGVQIRLTADTDSEGKFQFTGLPPGTYRLSATHSTFLERRARRPITLGPGGHVTDAEIRLPPQGGMSGRILDEDGDPVDRARVWLFKQSYKDGRKHWERLGNVSLTNEAGEYRFRELTPGRYIVRAESQRAPVDNRYGGFDRPISHYVPVFYPNAPNQQAALPVDVGVGADVRGIDVHLFKLARPASVRVAGRVTGVPPGSQTVVSMGMVATDSAGGSGSALANPPDYAFELRVPPGQYAIMANVYSGGAPAYAATALTVTGNVSDLILTMSPAPQIAGQVSAAESGRLVKLQGVRVTLRNLADDTSPEAVSNSNAAGKLVFAQPVRPGRYALDVKPGSIPEGCFVQKVKLGGQEVSPDDFEIKSSAPLEIVLSTLAGKITGSVTDSDGHPFLDSSATLISADGKSRPRSQVVGEGGAFQFSALAPGKYKLYAWERLDDAQWQDPEFCQKYDSKAAEITIGPSETRNVKLRAIATEEIN